MIAHRVRKSMDTTGLKGQIRTQVEGAIGYLTISNPRKYNAMSTEMWKEFALAVVRLNADPAVRVIVVRGDGDDSFVSGADISQFENRSADSQTDAEEAAANAYRAPGRADKPVIAAIRGICMGGGLGIAARM